MYEYVYFENLDYNNATSPNISSNMSLFNDSTYGMNTSYQDTANCYLFSLFLDVDFIIKNSFGNNTSANFETTGTIRTSTAPGDLNSGYKDSNEVFSYHSDIKVFNKIITNNDFSINNYGDLINALLVTFETNMMNDCNMFDLDIQRYFRGDNMLEGYHKIALYINPYDLTDFHFIIEGDDNIWYSKNGYDPIRAVDNDGYQVIDPLLAN